MLGVTIIQKYNKLGQGSAFPYEDNQRSGFIPVETKVSQFHFTCLYKVALVTNFLLELVYAGTCVITCQTCNMFEF